MTGRPIAATRSKRWMPLGIALVVGGAGIALRALALDQEARLRGWSPGCFVHRLTGFHCAGCGGTRAFFAFLKGDFELSWRMNPLFLTALGLGGMWGLLTLLDRLPSGRPAALRWLRMTPVAGWVTLGLVVIFSIVRNFPQWPFTLLAPR